MDLRPISVLAVLLALGVHLRAEQAEPPEQETDGPEKAAEKPGEKWSVAAPPDPTREVEIDTDEGTWMSLDVSPDGGEVVFDLLGDIYAVNLSGRAKSLTSGIPWDMQPRYSPDGRFIAFTSDRGGGDNIWVMDRDGSNPRQVTKESFRLLNSPAWTPDGQYIAARKHFTSRRSLGAGEIWLYHRTGGDGVQLVARPNDQKDLGEPAFSPDGRYLYYSRDATPGSTFEYNKDTNQGIYAIYRLDRETGDVEQLIGGPGGAIRPTPSPDGRAIAFVRRVRAKSVLFLHDIESGAERPISGGLERDMQETWAVHGVYPSMAWTPDSGSVVFWAGGRIRRVDVATKNVSTIPFRVRDTRRVVETLRYPIAVCPDEFEVRMLRWVRVSPVGDRVVFQALGHLYLRDLPDGTARRLTQDTGVLECYPSFSRDGSRVVYATWDDEELGAIREASIEGGHGRRITTEPGHYIEPAYSPDGRSIVYRKVAGGSLTSSTWARPTGRFQIPSGGGTAVLITKQGAGPHFGAASDRVFFTESDGGKRALMSIDLDGSDVRTHLRSENATEVRVSPDGRWVAFAERFNVFILPFIPTGTAIDVGPSTKSLPLVKVSHDAGEYLHWAGDSSALHWTLGPELFTRELKDAFSFLEGSPEKLPERPRQGRNISLRVPSDAPEGKLALVGGRVVTMRGDEVIESGTVIVERNRLVAVGSRGEVVVPDDARVVDCEGLTIIPGLIDVHAHGPQGDGEIIPEQNRVSFSELSFGVTTIHDPSSDTSAIFAASEMSRAGIIVSPRIFSTGTILYGAAGASKAEIDSLDDARFHLRRMRAVGAFSVKSYNQPRRDQRQQIITAARELKMMVVPEGGSLFQHNMTMVVDGHTGIEHSLPVARIYGDVLSLWRQTGTQYTPTLGVAYGGLWGENYWYQKTNVWENERLLAFVPREVIDADSRRRTMAPDDEFNHLNNARICKELTDAGVRVQLGAHGQREGLAAHWELWMFVQGGMTPHEALRAGTLNGAIYLGLDGDIGSLEKGKLADLIVLERNPLESIRDSEHVRYTMVNGRLFDARTMNELGNHPRERMPFFFEREPGNAVPASSSVCGCRP